MSCSAQKWCCPRAPAQEADVLLTLGDVTEVQRQRPPAREQVHLERQQADARGVLEHVLQGVFETRPPSQKNSPSTSTAGNPGGRAPLAITCSGRIVCWWLSK